MFISVIIPAHNEERYIGSCLRSIREAESLLSTKVEVVVCLNRCIDKTENIARSFGAVITTEDSKNIAKVRNTGAKASSENVIVTIDADSRMSRNMLVEIQRLVRSQKFIGGGTKIKPERLSLGIIASSIIIFYYALRFGLKSAGLFWCLRKDFDAIGGFNENLLTLEDLDFANRLSKFGMKKGLKYGTAWKASITTSCRKFDKFGDWYFLKTLK